MWGDVITRDHEIVDTHFRVLLQVVPGVELGHILENLDRLVTSFIGLRKHAKLLNHAQVFTAWVRLPLILFALILGGSLLCFSLREGGT